ncbi:hypothetical protein Ahy_A07g031938 [Arachis hypogaea]|uniref:NAC domain-containing protein n=1 Tax=Arachis hypogaea TaxID=3818 RepID=A0A445C5M1_ARAHY|nr:hypothetical protein Ahy_A07g031938 [Arachis hypogaea]
MVRTNGLGSWEGEDIRKEIMANKTNQRIGMRKRYRFEKSGTSHDGGWILHQYSIDSSLLPNPSNVTNQSGNNGDEKIDEILRELTNQLENNNRDDKIDEILRELINQLENNNGDEIKVETLVTTVTKWKMVMMMKITMI